MDDFATNVLRINSELDQKIERYEDDVNTYQDEMSALDERITGYAQDMRYSLAQSVVNSLKTPKPPSTA